MVRYASGRKRSRLTHRKRDRLAPDYFELVSGKGSEKTRVMTNKNRISRLERLRKLGKQVRKRLKVEKHRNLRRGRTVFRNRPGQIGRAVFDIDEKELAASICRESFYEFVKEFWETVVAEKFTDNWHIKYLCDIIQTALERVFKGEAKAYDVVTNIAPGTTKSLIFSVMMPAWAWTRMSSFRFIGASYSFPLAMDLSTKSRDVVQSEKYKEYFPEVVLRADQNTKGYFKTTKGGFRYAVGVNGAITGMHAHVLVIDDPLNPQEATSSADIATANHWIKHTLSTRKVDKAISVMFLVMQRLHQDDPTSQFLKAKKVRHICLPAVVEPNIPGNVQPSYLVEEYQDIDGIKYMDRKRLGPNVIEEEKLKGEYYFSSQFLQDPVPVGGGMFKTVRLKTGVPPKKWVRVVRYWDKAGTEGGGTYTVGTKIGHDTEGRFWVLNVRRERLDSFERERMIERVADDDGPTVEIGIEQEPGSGGKESAESTARRLYGYRVRIYKVDASTGGKIQRADPWSVQVNAGNVYLPMEVKEANEWVDWAGPWVDEHRYFPYSRYKDQVDSASGGFNMCQKKKVRIGGIDPSESYADRGVVDPTSARRVEERIAYHRKKSKIGMVGLGK